MKLSSCCSETLSTNWLIQGTLKQTLGHILLRSVKPTHIFHFSLSFFTTTTFTNHYGWFISQTKPASKSLSISFSAILCLLRPRHLFFYCIGLNWGWTFRWCVMTYGSIPGMFECGQANTSRFCFNKVTISSLVEPWRLDSVQWNYIQWNYVNLSDIIFLQVRLVELRQSLRHTHVSFGNLL